MGGTGTFCYASKFHELGKKRFGAEEHLMMEGTGGRSEWEYPPPSLSLSLSLIMAECRVSRWCLALRHRGTRGWDKVEQLESEETPVQLVTPEFSGDPGRLSRSPDLPAPWPRPHTCPHRPEPASLVPLRWTSGCQDLCVNQRLFMLLSFQRDRSKEGGSGKTLLMFPSHPLKGLRPSSGSLFPW